MISVVIHGDRTTRVRILFCYERNECYVQEAKQNDDGRIGVQRGEK